jgi:DNA-binding NarL/FixJ family response regulator
MSAQSIESVAPYILADDPNLLERAASLMREASAIVMLAGERCYGSTTAAALGSCPFPQLPGLLVTHPLTPREREVAVGMACGCSNRQIANTLSIAIATVERHASNIFIKLGVHSRAQVAVWAMVMGLFPSEFPGGIPECSCGEGAPQLR